VVAARHQHGLAIAHRQRLVEAAVLAVDALQREATRRVDAEVVGLLEQRLGRQRVAVVLVRRVARPVPGRRVHLAHQQRLGPLAAHQDRVDRALLRAVPAGLGDDARGRQHARLGTAPRRGVAEAQLGGAADREAGARGEVRGVGRAAERALAATEAAPVAVLGGDVDMARDHDDAALALARLPFDRLPGADLERLEADVFPAGRLRRDDRARRHEQVAHGASRYRRWCARSAS
jgi:hypothetical protein